MLILYIVVAVALLVSLVFDRSKTVRGLRIAWMKFRRILPSILVLTIGVSTVLHFLPEETIARILGEDNMALGTLSASLIGSIAFIPGFIVFPLCGLLRDQGVSFTVLSAFTTTLMMVGVLTFGIEKQTLGTRLAVVRNLSGFVMALLVALATGLVFGEIGV